MDITKVSNAQGVKVVEVGLNVAKCCATCRHFNDSDIAKRYWEGSHGWGACSKHFYDNRPELGSGKVALLTHEALFCSDEHWECDEDNTEVTNYVCAAITKAREVL